MDRGIWASPPPKMTIFSTGEVFVVILPAAAERFWVAYNASQFGSFVTKRQIPSGLLKDSSPPSTVCGQISVLHEVKGGKDGADNQSDGREDRRIFQQNRRNPVCHGDGRDRLVNGEWRHCPPFAMFSSSRTGGENCVINAHLWVLYLPLQQRPESPPTWPAPAPAHSSPRTFFACSYSPEACTAHPSPPFHASLLPVILLLYSELAIVLKPPLPPPSVSPLLSLR